MYLNSGTDWQVAIISLVWADPVTYLCDPVTLTFDLSAQGNAVCYIAAWNICSAPDLNFPQPSTQPSILALIRVYTWILDGSSP